MKLLRIGTRCSPLALIQTEIVSQALSKYCEKIEVFKIQSFADMVSLPLTEIGGKALFLKELQHALLGDEIDIAVHSLKDVPAVTDDLLEIVPVLGRGNPRDAFVSFRYKNIDDVPEGSIIGTCAPRRIIQLRHKNKFKCVPIRGNVATRIDKARQLDGIVVAACGLERLGYPSSDYQELGEKDMLPAVGQATLAIEFKKSRNDLRELISKIMVTETMICTKAERAFLETIGGDCSTALGGFAQIKDNTVFFTGMLGKEDIPLFISMNGSLQDSESIGKEAAIKLLYS